MIGSCAERAKLENTDEARERVAFELIDFQNELQRLVASNPITSSKVAIISTPPAFDAAALLHIARVIKQ